MSDNIIDLDQARADHPSGQSVHEWMNVPEWIQQFINGYIRVRNLHRASDGIEGASEFALRMICLNCGQDWPCQTTRALDGEQA